MLHCISARLVPAPAPHYRRKQREEAKRRQEDRTLQKRHRQRGTQKILRDIGSLRVTSAHVRAWEEEERKWEGRGKLELESPAAAIRGTRGVRARTRYKRERTKETDNREDARRTSRSPAELKITLSARRPSTNVLLLRNSSTERRADGGTRMLDSAAATENTPTPVRSDANTLTAPPTTAAAPRPQPPPTSSARRGRCRQTNKNCGKSRRKHTTSSPALILADDALEAQY
ncbi:hypothetical protein C8R45DRAFT_934402 [Mycena sanguinolenta]|nr:hypothetical protein C8R45DRAFT_934402 [Mycena sanguinolenta]